MKLGDIIGLEDLMRTTRGSAETVIGLIDGPVFVEHVQLSRARIRHLPGRTNHRCRVASSAACRHGTSVAGLLVAERESGTPGICPDCTLLVRPIFGEDEKGDPSASADELALAILDTLNAGAQIINLSAALVESGTRGEAELEAAINEAAGRGVVIVAAAGNHGVIGGSVITRHPWVVPVVACDSLNLPLSGSNLGHSIGRRGVLAPGEQIRSLDTRNGHALMYGTSPAASIVTGALALILSETAGLRGAELKLAIVKTHHIARKQTIVPPRFNVHALYAEAQTYLHQ
jgi:subtilisin family serine protease